MKSFLAFLLTLLHFSSFAQVNLDSGLVACYALNGNAHEPINNLNGTLNFASAVPDRFNTANSAMAINFGSIELPSNALLKPGILSFSAWIRGNAAGQILYTQNMYNDPAYSLGFETTGYTVFQVKKTNNNFLSVFLNGTSQIGASMWYHVCFTIDYNYIKLYVNGVLESTLNANMSFGYDAGKKVYLGNGFSGRIDNARFYNRVLSAAEVSQLYTNDPVCINTTAAPVTSFSISSTQCVGDTITFKDLSSNYPSSWQWTVPGGSTSNSLAVNPSYVFTTSGTYTAGLLSSNALGSDTHSISFVVHSNPSITSVANPTHICQKYSSTLQATGASSYSWSNGSWSSVPTGSMIVVSPIYLTIYTVVATDTLGCKGKSTVMVKVSSCHFSGLETYDAAAEISIYPNPGNGKISIGVFNAEFKSYELFDVLGSLVLKGKLENEDKNELDFGTYPNGIYFLKLISTKSSRIIKLVKE